jgi:hypothetical protein
MEVLPFPITTDHALPITPCNIYTYNVVNRIFNASTNYYFVNITLSKQSSLRIKIIYFIFIGFDYLFIILTCLGIYSDIVHLIKFLN